MSRQLNRLYDELIQAVLLKIRNGELVLKRKSPITSEKAKNDPKYEEFRNGGKELGIATKAGKLLREVIASIGYPDSTMHWRLNALFSKIIKTEQQMKMDREK